MNHHTHYNYSGGSGISGKHRNRIKRDNEFMDYYRRVLDLMLEAGVSDARHAAVEYVTHNFRPHYHVSYDRAYLVVSSILNQGVNPVKPSNQASMWEELALMVKQLCSYGDISVPRALEFVLDNCRASQFFFTPDYAYHKINKTLKS
ncbi:MAG: hypothetical protein MJZ74_04040 [Muribaculaceae bacterium]|nr:hypothetical protein [Muribaculaceae bacterium]